MSGLTAAVADITYPQLLLCLGFVLLAGLASLFFRLKLERDLFWGTIRTFAQLFIVGYVLQWVFGLNDPYVVVGIYVMMIAWAAQAVRARVREKKIPVFIPTFVSMVASYVLVAYVVVAVILGTEPWYRPQYFIPLGGMIVGNSMNAIAIALDRMLSDIRKRRDEIELKFCLGATYRQATVEIVRDAIRAGMIPSINALMTVGLVSLPGMMTGQILQGGDPTVAVKYQIVVMLMLVASTAIGCIVVTNVIGKMCFTECHQMKL